MSERRIGIELGAKDRAKLNRIVADGNTRQKIVKRAKIVLLTAEGQGVMAIMREVEVSKTTVWRWQDYFVEAGVAGLLKGRSKPPGKKPIAAEIKLKLVEKTVKERPANATHWSVRLMAEEMGISHTSVQRIWHEHGLKPHLVRSFKVSNDPDFAEKVEDIVGLYLDPPERALVLSIDEKSQIQALDRTQPGLPMKKGRAGTMTHDYKRNGTTTLFAALDVASGMVIGECKPRHRATEFLEFLKKIDRETPAHLDLHLIADNYATHKTPAVKRWLKRHPRFHLHFTPTSSSQSRRTAVRRDHPPAHPARYVHKRTGAYRSDRTLDCATQRQSQALHLDQNRKETHSQPPPRPKSPRQPSRRMHMNESEH
jgi:transposase